MGETKHMLFARNLVSICVDSYDNADYQGTLWHQYSDDSIEFGSIAAMMTKMDELMDDWDFPQKGLEQREFIREEKSRFSDKRPSDGELVIDKIQQMSGTRNVQNKRGKLATFIVHVAFRQNATWQGQVVIVNENEQEDFKSAMELLIIMCRRIDGNESSK